MGVPGVLIPLAYFSLKLLYDLQIFQLSFAESGDDFFLFLELVFPLHVFLL